jgi:hypothetical protein
MESFIVRVYRRNRTKTGELSGLVETVGTDDKRVFHTFAGLITALKHAVLRGESHATNPVELASYTPPDKKQAG